MVSINSQFYWLIGSRALIEQKIRKSLLILTQRLGRRRQLRGRWGSECVYCGNLESDIHLFSCAGYSDLIGDLKMELFFTQDASIDELFVGAQKLLRVIQRLELFNTSKD